MPTERPQLPTVKTSIVRPLSFRADRALTRVAFVACPLLAGLAVVSALQGHFVAPILLLTLALGSAYGALRLRRKCCELSNEGLRLGTDEDFRWAAVRWCRIGHSIQTSNLLFAVRQRRYVQYVIVGLDEREVFLSNWNECSKLAAHIITMMPDSAEVLWSFEAESV